MTYDFEKIENKWKEKWYSDNIYEAVDFSPKPKKYILAEFPYPSGAALHSGHMMRYTVPDIYSRYLRMNGYNVLFPIGWDAFGLPAENYAIKTGVHPAVTTKKAIDTMKSSLQRMGYGIDWEREISTMEPKYYKWTQWLFLKFYEHGLAELREMPIWWCEKLKTVLADEEILTDKDGNKISERGEFPVERRMLKQWVLKIPEYAEKLIKGLDEVDFPNSIKQAQINWIGKSQGAELNFKVKGSDEVITVFTTRIDTVYGATFIAVSPEHPLIDVLTDATQKDRVEEYREQAKSKSDLERTELSKEKTGIFTGSYAVNPFSGREIPIWTADFVVMGYGTGAVMGVPAHDERDYGFAQKFNLPVKTVVVSKDLIKFDPPYTEEGVVSDSGEFSGLSSEVAKAQMTEKAENLGFGQRKTNYKLRDWIFSRQRYWGEPIPLMYVEPDGHIEAEAQLPLTLPDIPNYEPTSDALSPLAKDENWVNTTSPSGKPAKRETNTMPNWAGSCWYFIRYIDPQNDKVFADMEKMKYWLPVDRYFGGAEHTTMHLLYSRFWYKFFYEIGLVPTSEPYSWRINGGLLLGPDGRKMSKSIGNVIDPMTVVENYGADALKMYISFLGPYEDTYPWNENGIKSTFRLISTVYEFRRRTSDTVEDQELNKAFHKMLKNVTQMIENLKMNTAISEIMIFVNEAKKRDSINRKLYLQFIKVLAPFAPFAAEEIWQEVNGFKEWSKVNSVHLQEWPKFDLKLVESDEITLPIQINGKVREYTTVSQSDSEDVVKEKVMNSPKIKELLAGKEIVNFIYIPGKIISVVFKK
jgi:leucyl-tRNA synthetase